MAEEGPAVADRREITSAALSQDDMDWDLCVQGSIVWFKIENLRILFLCRI